MLCYRLGTILYLDLKKGGEETKTSEFKQDIGGTVECTKIIIRGTKGCGQM